MLDLLFCKITGVIRFDGLTILAHSFGAMLAHPVVARSLDLSILLIQGIIEWHLLDSVPRVVDALLGGICGDGNGGVFLRENFLAIQSVSYRH